jgi:type II secretory pathway pseudopilin PulG
MRTLVGRVARTAARARSGATSDRGETLVEVLAAVVILGIAGVAIMAGLTMSVRASDMHRKETDGGAYVRSYAEAVQEYVAAANSHYKPCAGAGDYAPGVVGFSGLPPGYTASQPAAAIVLKSDGSEGLCADEAGIQKVQVQVASGDGRATEKLWLVLRKPCAVGC